MNMKKLLLLNTLLLAIAFFTTQAFAHSYHYEIQVSNNLQTNDKDQLEALNISFLYDGDVSKVMLQDENNLEVLGNKLIKDLGQLGYFTQVKVNGVVVDTQKASEVKLNKITSNGKEGKFDVLQLNFTLKLKAPAPLIPNSEIAFDHEDPTAVAILYYENAKQIILGNNLKDNCKASVKEKDKFEEGEFPQIVRVRCKT